VLTGAQCALHRSEPHGADQRTSDTRRDHFTSQNRQQVDPDMDLVLADLERIS
jgi:hypothetical protein